MQNCKTKITKEDYDLILSKNPNGHVVPELQSKFFSDSVIWGYGLYGAKAVKTDDGYELQYKIGNSCD